MPHRPRALLEFVQRGIPFAMLAAVACTRSGELRVLADSTTASGAVEVLALPDDPAALVPRDPARLRADTLNALFQRDRASLNRLADSLNTADRRTPSYAAAYADFADRTAAAERLRSARDSARRTLAPAPALPDALLTRAKHATIVHGGATLTLEAGVWWVAAADARGALRTAPMRITIAAGAHDTLRMKPPSY